MPDIIQDSPPPPSAPLLITPSSTFYDTPPRAFHEPPQSRCLYTPSLPTPSDIKDAFERAYWTTHILYTGKDRPSTNKWTEIQSREGEEGAWSIERYQGIEQIVCETRGAEGIEGLDDRNTLVFVAKAGSEVVITLAIKPTSRKQLETVWDLTANPGAPRKVQPMPEPEAHHEVPSPTTIKTSHDNLFDLSSMADKTTLTFLGETAQSLALGTKTYTLGSLDVLQEGPGMVPIIESIVQPNQEESIPTLTEDDSVLSICYYQVAGGYESYYHTVLQFMFSNCKGREVFMTHPTSVPEPLMLQSFVMIPTKKQRMPSNNLYRLYDRAIRPLVLKPYREIHNKMLEDVYTCDKMDGGYTIFDDTSAVGYIAFAPILPNLQNDFQLDDLERPQLLRACGLSQDYWGQTRYILMEGSRLSGAGSVISIGQQNDVSTQQISKKELHRVVPRRVVEYPDNNKDGNDVEPQVDFAIRGIERQRLLVPIRNINHRIVIVGASETALGLLEQFQLQFDMRFTALTLLSIDSAFRYPSIHFPESIGMQKDEISRLGLHETVTIVRDRLVAIDREKKQLFCLKRVLPYDMLVLVPGLQQQVPKQLSSPMILPYTPSHQILIKGLLSNSKTVGVIGSGLEALCALKTVAHAGLKSVLIMTGPTEPENLAESYAGERFMGIPINITENTVTVRHEGTSKTISVDGLLYAKQKSIDRSFFAAINDAGLVFDERLVVDRSFATNDKHILAAGPATRWSARYRTEWQMDRCSSREVGAALARQILSMVNQEQPTSDDLPVFNHAKSVRATLPNDFHFIHYDVPHLPGNGVSARYKKSLGTLLETKHNGNWMRMLVDKKGLVISITYFGHAPVTANNWMALYGLHESYLNGICSRYADDMIPDLKGFLAQTWAYAIYHDKFRTFAANLMKQITVQRDDESQKREENTMASNLRGLSSEERSLYLKAVEGFLKETKAMYDVA